MATPAYVETLMGALNADIRRVFRVVFTYLLANLRFGRPDATTGKRSENFQLYPVEGTTPSVANTEFSIAHRLGVAPYLALPVLPLQTQGAKMVRLEVSRVADTNRVYLKSPDTDATFTLLIEG